MAIKIVKEDEKQTGKDTSAPKKGQVSKDDSNYHICNCHCGGGDAKSDQHALVY